MIKRLAAAARIEQVRHASEISLEVSLQPGAIRDWSLGLVLLREQLIDALLMSESTGVSTLELRRSGGARVRFFLTYFRDGIAAVDHVDVQAITGEDGQECYITFMVPESAPPVSSAEARKRLGLK